MQIVHTELNIEIYKQTNSKISRLTFDHIVAGIYRKVWGDVGRNVRDRIQWVFRDTVSSRMSQERL